jgi:hypothetical protein
MSTMARSFGRGLFLLVLLLAADRVQAGDGFKQWMGCGYGPGYNAPVPPGGGCGLFGNNWGRGCCEIPASWRLNVWDGYRGDPRTYQRSLVGAQPDYIPVPSRVGHYGVGIPGGIGDPGAYYNGQGACTNCQGGGAGYINVPAVPVPDPVPAATDLPPYGQSGRVTPSIRSLR